MAYNKRETQQKCEDIGNPKLRAYTLKKKDSRGK